MECRCSGLDNSAAAFLSGVRLPREMQMPPILLGRTMMRAFAAGAVLLLWASAWGAPVIHWASEPAGPGQVVLVYGGDLQTTRNLRVSRLQDGDPKFPPAMSPALRKGLFVEWIEAEDASAKFVIPGSLESGVFELAAQDGVARWRLNAPRPRWFQPCRLEPGLSEGEAKPGTAIQLIGANFLIDGAKGSGVRVAVCSASGLNRLLPVEQAEPYSLVLRLPTDLPPGDYALWVHNGYGGPAGWGGPLALHVRNPVPWKTEEWNVRQLGAKGDNVADDTLAFQVALQKAARSGGGIVRVPAGTYRLHGSLSIPAKTTLKGEGSNLTWLKWPLTEPRTVEAFQLAALYGAGEYAIEDLSIVVRNTAYALLDLSWVAELREMMLWRLSPDLQGRVAPLGRERDIFLRRVRIDYEPFCGRPSDKPAEAAQSPQWLQGEWGITDTSPNSMFALCIGASRNVEISDSDILGSERLMDLGGARIVRNRFSNEMGMPWTDVGGQKIVFAGNALPSTAGFRPWHLPLRELYVAHNETSVIQRGEREALGWEIDGLMGADWPERKIPAWVGRPAGICSGKEVELVGPPLVPNAYRGLDALIVSGRGSMQCRTVSENTESKIVLLEPWEVAPDASSVLIIHQMNGHFIWYKNHAQDASSFGEMYATGTYDVVFDENSAERTQGMWGLSGWLVQWLRNRLSYAVTYQQGIGPEGSGRERTEEGGLPFGTMGVVAWEAIWGSRNNSRFPLAKGLVIRENVLQYGNRILMMLGYGGEKKRVDWTPISDCVIDGNKIDHSPVGIDLDENVHSVVVGRNDYSDVERPLCVPSRSDVRVLSPQEMGGSGRSGESRSGPGGR